MFWHIGITANSASTETKGKTLEQMDELFGDQLVPHALEDPKGAAIAMEKNNIETHEEVVKYWGSFVVGGWTICKIADTHHGLYKQLFSYIELSSSNVVLPELSEHTQLSTGDAHCETLMQIIPDRSLLHFASCGPIRRQRSLYCMSSGRLVPCDTDSTSYGTNVETQKLHLAAELWAAKIKAVYLVIYNTGVFRWSTPRDS